MRSPIFLAVALLAALSASQASAAFTFQFQPSFQAGVGTSGSFDILVSSTAPDESGAGYSLTLNISGDPDIALTTSNPIIGGAFTATAVPTAIESVGFSIAGSALSGDSATVTGTFTAFNSTTSTLESSLISFPMTITAVPEPSSLALLGMCTVGYVVRRRRR